MNGKNVANIFFETPNGSVGLLIFGAKTCIFASIDTSNVTSSMSSAAVKYTKLFPDNLVIDSINTILQDNETGKFRVKIKTLQGTSLGVFDIVAICPSLNGFSVSTILED